MRFLKGDLEGSPLEENWEGLGQGLGPGWAGLGRSVGTVVSAIEILIEKQFHTVERHTIRIRIRTNEFLARTDFVIDCLLLDNVDIRRFQISPV